MPAMETISIINKSGKVVSTTKHLVNIFKDAKEAYHDKKAEIRAESHRAVLDKNAQKMLRARSEVRSEASSRHRHHSSTKDDNFNLQKELPRRPALTEHTLSETSSRHGSHRASRHSSHRSPSSTRPPVAYQKPYFENADIPRPNLTRRHTESLQSLHESRVAVTHSSLEKFGPPTRSMSSPLFSEDIDMNLAYGDIPPPLPRNDERELGGLMSKLNTLMTEAQCVQHSATTIISGLQKNPEAMAAVALTLAEISNLLAKMSPGILTAIKAGSPAVFALLASPQFLIAGGVAIGVTVVMFGGYKIIRKLQKDAAGRKEAGRMDEAMVFNPESEIGSIETWRRGIAEFDAQSIATSVDGEFITPEAARQRKERIRERRREERPGSMMLERPRSKTSNGSDGSEDTLRRKDVPIRTSRSRNVASVSGRTESTESTIKPRKEEKKVEKKVKKPSALTVLFKKSTGKDKKGGGSGSGSGGHKQPKMLEL